MLLLVLGASATLLAGLTWFLIALVLLTRLIVLVALLAALVRIVLILLLLVLIAHLKTFQVLIKLQETAGYDLAHYTHGTLFI